MPFPKEKKVIIKELVIRQEWKDESKSGDEYRSLSKQIDNFLDFMDDKTTPLYWMPIDVMTEDEIAQIICSFIKRNKENKINRLILNNLDYEGIRYNYFSFVAHTPSNVRTQEIIYEVTPKLRDAKQWEIKEVMHDISNLWKSDTTYIRKISATDHWLHDIVACVLDEKRMYLVLGLGFTNPRYIEEFIDVVAYAAKLVIKNMIIFNDNAKDKTKCLSIINDYLSQEHPYINEYIDNSRISYKNLREKFPRKENDDMLSMYFAMYMQRKSLYDEISKISSIVGEDLPHFTLPDLGEFMNVKVSECSTRDVKRILCADDINDISSKIYRTQQFIKQYMEDGNNLWDDMRTVQIMFTAIYHSKASYHRKTIKTIVRNLLDATSELELKNLFFIFLNMKIEQIHYLKLGLGDAFPLYTNIINSLNKLLLLPYSTWDDEEAYKRIYHIGYDFLYPFAFKEQYGLML